jgi:hypothetical protein
MIKDTINYICGELELCRRVMKGRKYHVLGGVLCMFLLTCTNSVIVPLIGAVGLWQVTKAWQDKK